MNKEDTLDRGLIHRCSICNTVNVPDIETDIGDFREQSFTVDPKDKNHYICIPCFEVIEDLRRDYEERDGIEVDVY